jgi:hypothetical protein
MTCYIWLKYNENEVKYIDFKKGFKDKEEEEEWIFIFQF